MANTKCSNCLKKMWERDTGEKLNFCSQSCQEAYELDSFISELQDDYSHNR